MLGLSLHWELWQGLLAFPLGQHLLLLFLSLVSDQPQTGPQSPCPSCGGGPRAWKTESHSARRQGRRKEGREGWRQEENIVTFLEAESQHSASILAVNQTACEFPSVIQLSSQCPEGFWGHLLSVQRIGCWGVVLAFCGRSSKGTIQADSSAHTDKEGPQSRPLQKQPRRS